MRSSVYQGLIEITFQHNYYLFDISKRWANTRILYGILYWWMPLIDKIDVRGITAVMIWIGIKYLYNIWLFGICVLFLCIQPAGYSMHGWNHTVYIQVDTRREKSSLLALNPGCRPAVEKPCAKHRRVQHVKNSGFCPSLFELFDTSLLSHDRRSSHQNETAHSRIRALKYISLLD